MITTLFLTVFLLAGSTTANIVFHRVEPTCNATIVDDRNCLRGQICTKDGKCVPGKSMALDPFDIVRQIAPMVLRQVPRPDGRCGKNFNNTVCDPTGAFGGCCSRFGFCGVTRRHCRRDEGCQSNCAPNSGTIPRSPNAFGAAASPPVPPESNGSNQASEEPVLALPTGPSKPSPSSPVTKDGSCGANFGGTVCGDWPRGSCCSMYGYCGNSSSHCGAGCQSGDCTPKGASQGLDPRPAPANNDQGSFAVVGDSGVPAMHTALLPNGRVVFLDKVENFTNLQLSNGRYAYSAEWDPVTNKVVPLSLSTNPFCGGGAFLADGTLISVGGNGPLLSIDDSVGNGFKALRFLKRSISDDSLNNSWIDNSNMTSERWYASAQTLGDGRIFVASGSLNGLDPSVATNNNPTYEILSSGGAAPKRSISLDILVRTQPYYMYPFLHLLPTGDLFVFVSKSSELWSTTEESTLFTYPDLPGDYRTYPNTGSSVLLPLSSSKNWSPEVIVCGGGAYQDIDSPTDPSCGRIAPLAQDAKWELDAMPSGRSMLEGVLLPDGTIVFLNGCNSGAQGFGLAAKPSFQALLYKPGEKLGKRWATLASTRIPRLYHSVALLLLDGTIMVAGSNPVEQPVLRVNAATPFATEFRIEIYTPPYLSGDSAKRRPTNVTVSDRNLKADNSTFTLNVEIPDDTKDFQVTLYHGGFVTHSLHMGMRMVVLDSDGWKAGETAQEVEVRMPPNNNIAPPGPYVIYVLADGVPSVGVMVMVG